ncbi:MAG: hypothetical protein HDT28_03190 [Clostridiales bacterium]|nr:hypothetical protein [Clostridiales bacterium]
MYNVMRDWGKRGFIDVPYSSIYTDDITWGILNDPLYSEYGKGTKSGSDSRGSYKWIANYNYLKNMPILYSNIRSYALKKGYTPESGYYASDVPATMEYVANFLYDNNLGVEEAPSLGVVTSKIYSKKCCFLAITGSSTYGNHGVALIGYHKYGKETSVSDTYSTIEYKFFYEVADGGNLSSRIFDPNTPANPDLKFYYMARC